MRDILNSLTNSDYCESAYRKKYQSFEKILNANKQKFIKNESQEEITNQIQELKKEQVKIRDERNELNRIIREEARKESYKDLILRSISEHNSFQLSYDENKKFNGVLHSNNDMIISFTDIHAGICIDNSFNKYDEDILKKRMNKYLDKIFEVYLRHGCENIYVILSELLSGIIHNELRIENNKNLIEQFLLIMDYLSDFLAELSYKFNSVQVYMCPGNHSRISPKKQESLKGENMDHLAIPFLEAKLQNFKNIKFHKNTIDESIAIFSVRGQKIFAVHGDKDDLGTIVQKLSLFTGVLPNIIYTGHKHTNSMSTIYDVKVIQSGCLSGNDNYCLDKRLKNRPEQTISIITKDGLDCLYDVKF